ncbi:hypothetical protein BGZ76_003731 [Entomortierella beljakovae]|nr:hypothetical protein BGZ76_003731 [Entomortierella beljakovae]
MSFLFSSSRLSHYSNNNTYLHPISTTTPPKKKQLFHQILFKKQLPVYVPPNLFSPSQTILGTYNDPPSIFLSMNPTTSFSLTAVGFLTPKIKCLSDNNKKEAYTFQSKSDSATRNMIFKDANGNQVCKVKSKGEHLLDLHLTTDSKDINVQFRDMVAFKKAVEKNTHGNSLRVPHTHQPGDEDDERTDPRYGSDSTSNVVSWAFEFEGRIYQWTAPSGHSVHAPPGSEVLICHCTSAGPATRVAKLSSGHTGASDKLVISNSSTANVIDKNGLQILLLISVLSLMEIMNDRSRDLIDFE